MQSPPRKYIKRSYFENAPPKRAGEVAHPSKGEALSSNPSTTKKKMYMISSRATEHREKTVKEQKYSLIKMYIRK
jgi:hypothetical protein